MSQRLKLHRSTPLQNCPSSHCALSVQVQTSFASSQVERGGQGDAAAWHEPDTQVSAPLQKSPSSQSRSLRHSAQKSPSSMQMLEEGQGLVPGTQNVPLQVS